MALARLLISLAALAASGIGAASAQTYSLVDENALRAYVSQHVAAANGNLATRFDIRFLPVDTSAVQLGCRRSEAFIPAGIRLWGRSSVGLRCVDGASWTVMLPMQVSVWGTGLVAAQPLAAGAIVSEQDLREGEIELTRETQPVSRDPAALIGRTLARAINPGQPVRADMVRVTTVVQAGDPVRLRIVGKGFAVTSAGQAMNNAGEGQSVRVRTDLGKVLTGVARDGRQVDVTL